MASTLAPAPAVKIANPPTGHPFTSKPMKRFLLSLGLAAACATSAPAQDEHAVWVPDFDQAVAARE